MLHFDQQNSKRSQRWPYQSKSAPRARNYLARGEQRRLLGLVLMVGLVFLLMGQVANPDRWKWMWGGVPAAAGGPEPRVDNRVRRHTNNLPDAVQIAAAPAVAPAEKNEETPERKEPERIEAVPVQNPKEADPPSADSKLPAASENAAVEKEPVEKEPAQKDSDVKEPPAKTESKEPAVAAETKEPGAKETAPPQSAPDKKAAETTPLPQGDKPFAGVDPAIFNGTRDDTMYIDFSPFYRLCKILEETDEKSLAEASIGKATFLQLYRQPKEYRGKLVNMRGKMLRAFRIPARKNDFGITGTYQTWFVPEGGHDPIQVFVLELPPNLPISKGGMEVNQEVEFTGFFLQIVAFQAQDAIRKVPLLVARSVSVIQAPPAPVLGKEIPPEPTTLIWVVLGAVLFSVVLVAVVFSRTQRTKRIRPSNAAERIINEHLASLKRMPQNSSFNQDQHDTEN